jgi:phosphomannomutase
MNMALKFGTSGVRGLVTEMNDRACVLYARAYMRYLLGKGGAKTVYLGGDLRSSTPRILKAVSFAVRQEGGEPSFCGILPTPALAAYARTRDSGCIMVTGSHIPDDRNGIKFYLPSGEVLKNDEREIARLYGGLSAPIVGKEGEFYDARGDLHKAVRPALGVPDERAAAAYRQRLRGFFPPGCLAGLRLVFYQHSSSARDILPPLLKELGAEVTAPGRSESFIPVDTEAVENPAQLAAMVGAHGADALLSTDGDADRPLLADGQGKIIRGDLLGILVARYLKADAVVTPVSSNTAIERCGWFQTVRRTRIGSPYVIAALNELLAEGYSRVVGYEANGGFLTGSDLQNPAGGAVLPALPTRDAALPLIAALAAARSRGLSLAELVATLPARYTVSGLLRGIATERGRALVARFETEGGALAGRLFGELLGEPARMDFTDGARIRFASGVIVHLRPSGNAPEFRSYVEADSPEEAARINDRALAIVTAELAAETGS